MKTFDVFRTEWNICGKLDWIGTVEAHDDSHAQIEAEARFDCLINERIYVEEIAEPNPYEPHHWNIGPDGPYPVGIRKR